MPVLAWLIAAAFAVAGLVPVLRSALRQPIVWILVAVGGLTSFIAQWAGRALWAPVAVTFGIPDVGTGLVVHLFVLAALGEALKIAPVLVLGHAQPTPAGEWFVYGASVGAGFGLVGAQLIIALTLAASTLPVSSVGSAVLAVALRLFPVLAHIATTAWLAWATARGRFGATFLVVVLAQTALGLVERGAGALGLPVGGLLLAALAAALYAYVWLLPVPTGNRGVQLLPD